MFVRAFPFEYTCGVERSPIKKSWGEGGKIKNNHWARGLSNIEKHGAGATWQKNKHRVWGIYYIYTEKSQDVSKNPKRADACKFQSMKFRAGAL